MKNKLFILLFFSLVLTKMSACKKEGKGIGFNLRFEEEFIISSGNPLNLPFNVLLPDVETNSQAQFAQNDTRAENITDIKLTSLGLSILSPQNQDFSFIKDVEIFINAEGLDETRLAYRFDVNTTEKVLDLIPDESDFAEYIKKDKYSLRVRTVVKSTFNNNIRMKADILFRVRAKLIK